jgi:hypothetical protein
VRGPVAALLLVLGWGSLGAQAGTSVAWNPAPEAAEASARSLGKPVVLLWQAGPTAPAFTQSIESLLAAWPSWLGQAQLAAVFTRGRSWEGPLPPTYPPLADPQSPALMVWTPGRDRPEAVWTEAPPVLEFSRTLAQASGRDLADPYRVDVVAYQWDEGTLTRTANGPRWVGTGPEGASDWVEEGPLGTVLLLREVPAGRRAALPLEGDWSFLFDPATQTWAPWKPVLVKRR